LAIQEPELNLDQLSDRRGAAFHEAGHTVVAWALGVPVGSMEIAIDDDDAKGGAQIGATDGLPTIDRIAICLAGMEAQHMFAAPTHELAGIADFAMVMSLIEGANDEEGLALRNAGFQRAHDILEVNRSTVEDLARNLLRYLKLDETSVRRILDCNQNIGATPSQISMMITNAQREHLRRLGCNDEAISNMTPAQAHKALGISSN
jgi:hypothetical protein